MVKSCKSCKVDIDDKYTYCHKCFKALSVQTNRGVTNPVRSLASSPPLYFNDKDKVKDIHLQLCLKIGAQLVGSKPNKLATSEGRMLDARLTLDIARWLLKEAWGDA